MEGFAKECAIVTHHRLKQVTENGKVTVVPDPESKLEEEYVIRPTSETVIWDMYRKWIQSYRDLPILINQWANVMRWELRTRMFLRTTEFLWQEGHTAHATAEEARAETLQMLEVYRWFAEDILAMPVIPGAKTASERFAGAVETFSIEAMMQDSKALQAATSHDLGQNFARAFDVKFQDQDGKVDLVWATSWGMSTRIIGALIMTHSDDDGLVLPPRIAGTKAVIVPIWKNDDEKAATCAAAHRIAADLRKAVGPVVVDDRDNLRPGSKYGEWERRGVPLRLEIGPRDLDQQTVMLKARHDRAKTVAPMADVVERGHRRARPHPDRPLRARRRPPRRRHPRHRHAGTTSRPSTPAPAASPRATGAATAACEKAVQDELAVTIRNIPLRETRRPAAASAAASRRRGGWCSRRRIERPTLSFARIPVGVARVRLLALSDQDYSSGLGAGHAGGPQPVDPRGQASSRVVPDIPAERETAVFRGGDLRVEQMPHDAARHVQHLDRDTARGRRS